MNCPLCFYDKSSLVYPKTRSGRIVQCDRCGFAFADSAPMPGYGDEKKAVFDQQGVYLQNARHRLAFLKESTGIESGALLDVGCNRGTFGAAAQEMGFSVRGVEPDPEAAAAAEREFGFTVHQGNFEDAKVEGGPFDVISFIHSFEHIADPHGATARTRNLLSEDGAVLIETPNYDCLFRKATGSKWRQFIRDHSVFYSPQTIKQLLESEGLQVIKTIAAPKLLSLSLLADRVERHYSKMVGKGIAGLTNAVGQEDRTIRLNLGDIMLTVAVFKKYEI